MNVSRLLLYFCCPAVANIAAVVAVLRILRMLAGPDRAKIDVVVGCGCVSYSARFAA